MKNKKTNYESKGFVRRLMKKGASFKSLSGGESLSGSLASNSKGRFGNNEDSKWRPRKNQFELLDCCDDEDSLSAALDYGNPSSWNIKNALSSAESETLDYRRDIMYEQKATALKKAPVKNKNIDRKRDLVRSPIKPPCKDSSAIRAPTSSAKKVPQKKQRQDIERGDNNMQADLNFSSNTCTSSDDPFFTPTTDSFGFEIHEKHNNAMKPSTISRHIEQSTGSRQTHPHSSYNTVISDPTDFFSKGQTTKLTMNNLAKMDSDFITTTNSTAKKNSQNDGMMKLVKERKFYQFAVDQDRTSTVVESTLQLPADYPGGDYSIDDDTEISCDETSQGTRIQQRSVTAEPVSELKQQLTEDDSNFFPKNTKSITTSETALDTLLSSNHSRNHANEVKAFDAFFTSDNGIEKSQGKKTDAFFSSSIDNDRFFPTFGGAKEPYPQAPPPAETEISSFGGDNYFDPRLMSTNELGGSGSSQTQRGRPENRHLQQSIKSLTYSVSPDHKNYNGVVPQNGRQPLTLKNLQPSSGGKKNKTFPVVNNTVPKKSDQCNEWFALDNVREHEAHFQFDNFAAPSSSFKKRQSSISSCNFQSPPADPFESSFPNQASAKENFAVKSNRYEDLDDWGMSQNKQQNQRYIRRDEDRPLQKSLCDDDSDDNEDDDSFDDVGQWERPAPTSIGRAVIVSQNRPNGISRARLTSSTRQHDHASYNRPSRNQYIDDYDDDDARSVSGFSVGKVSRASAGSRTKPLALPNNAIMASMLFQTQYDIDQNDVEEKITAFEQEQSRQKKTRLSQGGIPDAVDANDDYMTTVSSFSEGTSAYLQESWRKPSRDLLNHFNNTRALDNDYRCLPVRTSSRMDQHQGLLFEA